MRRFSIIVVVAFLLSLFCSGNLLAQDTLKLSIPLPLTGTQAKFGEMEKRSYEIAAEEINAKGGIKAKKLFLILRIHRVNQIFQDL